MPDEDQLLSRWANPRAGERYSALSDELWVSARQALEEAGLPTVRELDVETPFGTTHVFHWPGSGTPVVLLHGAGTSSLMWAFLVAHLVGLDLYALDAVGDPGRSVQRAPITSADDLAIWLDDTLGGLGLDAVHLVGASYGGYVALVHALRHPQRVSSLSLLEPVIDPLRKMFWVSGVATALALACPGSLKRRALHAVHMEALVDSDPSARKMAMLGQIRWRRKGLPRPVPVTDDELAALATPTLLLLGEHSSIHRSRDLLERATSSAPRLEGRVIADAAHSLPVDRAEEIAPLIGAFVGQHEAAASSD